MVYIHFPSNLTEEEHMLQAKYQKLKKKVILLSNTNAILLTINFLAEKSFAIDEGSQTGA